MGERSPRHRRGGVRGGAANLLAREMPNGARLHPVAEPGAGTTGTGAEPVWGGALTHPDAYELVLIEDDEGDAVLVEALLEDVVDDRPLGWFR